MMMHSIVIYYLMLFQGLSFGAGSTPENLAAGKKLRYSPQPGYRLTKHSTDPFLLTDSRKDESFWSERNREKTVGWQHTSLVKIQIDLEQVKNIDFINIYTTGGGRSGVEYPEFAAAAISRNGRDYVLAAFTISDSWVFGENKAIPKKMVLPIKNNARYINLYIRPTGNFFFADEVEVIESDNLEKSANFNDYVKKTDIIDYVERARQLQRDSRILLETIDKSTLENDNFAENFKEIKKIIARLNQNLTNEKLTEAESAFAKFKANYLKLKYKTDWLCFSADPIDILRHGNLPPDILDDDFKVLFYQWQNEYGSDTVNLTNCTGQKVTFKLNLSPLKYADKTIDSGEVFEIRRALYVRVLNAGLVADPLVLQNDKPFPVSPGETVQLWIQSHSSNLEPGEYIGALAIEAIDPNNIKKTQTIPIHLEIANKTFPEKLPFHYFNWAYLTYNNRFTSESPLQIKASNSDLNSHYINVQVIHPVKFFGRDGNLSLPKLNNELASRSITTKPYVLFYFGGTSHLERQFGSFRIPEWKTRFERFLKQLRSYMFNNGYNYNDFALYPFDESIGKDFVYVAQIIKEFDPRLRIYANKWFKSDNQFREVKNLINIWCPHLPDVTANRSKYEHYKSNGGFEGVWCYYANMPSYRFFAPTKTRLAKQWKGNNRSLWRTMPITAAFYEMDGAGFWTYQDTNLSSWEKDSINNFGVIYDGTKNPDKHCYQELIVPSKRWQQWREGVEDAVALSNNKSLLEEIYLKLDKNIDSDYIRFLRIRSDEIKN